MRGDRRAAGAVPILAAGASYFAIVFAAGFVLGAVRTLWLVPALGDRSAELIEAPFMLAVVVVTARWLVRRFALPPQRLARLAVGLLALALMLAAELAVVLWLRRLSLADYVASRDPVSGSVYLLSLGLFAVLPALLPLRRSG